MRRLLIITLCGAAALMVGGVSNAGATVTPSCIPTSNTPVTVLVPGITAFNQANVGIVMSPLSNPSQVSFGTLTNESITPSGLTATATFPAGLSSIAYEVAAAVVGTQPQFIDVGPLTVGCGVTPHPTSTSVTCGPTPVGPGDSRLCTAIVTDTATTQPNTPTGTFTFTSSSPATFSPTNPCPAAPSGTSAICFVRFSSLAAGTQTITASYSGDSTHSPSSSTAPLTVTPLHNTPGCRVTFKGQILTRNGDRAHFAGTAVGSASTGRERYRDRGPANALLMRSHSIDAVSCPGGGRRASVFGTGSLAGGTSVSYRIDVTTAGGGSYRIQMGNGYDSGVDKLRRGSIRIVRPG
jgi:hypothetical protein